MHIERCGQIGAVLLVEVVEVRGVLEVVCVQIAVNQCGVRLNVVGELNNVKGVALGLERGLRCVQNLCVRGRGSADGDDLVGVAGVCRSAVVRGGRAGAASGQSGQAQCACKDCCNGFLHGNSLLFDDSIIF